MGKRVGRVLQWLGAKAMQSVGPTACGPHGTAPPGPLARAGASGKGLLQTLRDAVPMGLWDSAQQFPRWHLLWWVWAVLLIIWFVLAGGGKVEAMPPSLLSVLALAAKPLCGVHSQLV